MVEGLDPRELMETARLVKDISTDIAAIREKLGAGVRDVKEGADKAKEAVVRVKLESEMLADELRDIARLARDSGDQFKDMNLRRLLDDATKTGRTLLSFKGLTEGINRATLENLKLAALRRAEYEKTSALAKQIWMYAKEGATGRPYAQLGMRALGVTGERGIAGAAQSGLQTIRGLMADVPFGGLLGFLMWGGVKNQEWEASVHRAMRQFSAVESTWRGKSVGLHSMMLSMKEKWLLDPQELASLTGAFAAGGAGTDIAGAALGRGLQPPEGFSKNILGLSLALDTTANVATGTFAKHMVEAMAVSGDSAKDVARDIANITVGFKDANVNVGALMSNLLQMSVGLRFQRQGVADLAAVYKVASDAMVGRGGLYANTAEGRMGAAAYTQAGMQSLAQSIGGLSVGMAAELARRSGIGDIEGYIAVLEGKVGKPGKHFSTMIDAMGKLVRELAPGDEARQKFVAMNRFGVDIAGANVLVKIQDAMENELNLEEAIEKHQDELNEAFRDRAKDTADWQKKMEQLTQGIALISGAMLGQLNLFRIQLMSSKLFGGTPIDAAAVEFAERRIGQDTRLGASKVAGALGSTLGAFGGGGQYDPRQMDATIKADIKAWAQRPELKHITNEKFKREAARTLARVYGREVSTADLPSGHSEERTSGGVSVKVKRDKKNKLTVEVEPTTSVRESYASERAPFRGPK